MLRKDIITIIVIGVPVTVFMILIGGGGHASFDFDTSIIPAPPQSTSKLIPSETVSDDCLGTAQCITGIVSQIIDGDTIKVNGESVRFALASAPELKGLGGVDSRNFIETLCPVDSTVLVDEDDGQILGSYGRMVGMVYCGEVNLNSELLDSGLGYLEERFCDSSEFAGMDWAVKHGC